MQVNACTHCRGVDEGGRLSSFVVANSEPSIIGLSVGLGLNQSSVLYDGSGTLLDFGPAACSTLLVARFRVVPAVYCMPCFNCCCVCACCVARWFCSLAVGYCWLCAATCCSPVIICCIFVV